MEESQRRCWDPEGCWKTNKNLTIFMAGIVLAFMLLMIILMWKWYEMSTESIDTPVGHLLSALTDSIRGKPTETSQMTAAQWLRGYRTLWEEFEMVPVRNKRAS